VPILAEATAADRSIPITALHGLGVTADELAAHAARPVCAIAARELRRWLLDEGLAVELDGLLYATRRARELGSGLLPSG
jgi:hypothetical protein